MSLKVYFVLILSAVLFSCNNKPEHEAIDRLALVTRNNVIIDDYDPLSSLSVGNGNFVFTTDLTGL